MHYGDIPLSPPMYIDLGPLPGQILASSKLLPCCVQYLQRLGWTTPTPSFPLWCLVFFHLPPLVGGAPPIIVPPTTNNHTYSRLQQCAWQLLQGSWWQYYRHHCGFHGTSQLYSKSCISLTESCLTGCCFSHSLTNSLILLPLTVMGGQVDRQLWKDLGSINLLAPQS